MQVANVAVLITRGRHEVHKIPPWIYIRFTPYDEIGLIREGNLAAAVSLTGALIGFAIPVAIVIAHSVNLVDMAAWALMATKLGGTLLIF